MFDGDSGGGAAEFQAQIMYLINEMDSRNDDLNKLKDIVNGVQFLSKADSGGNEEEMEEKELKTPTEKLEAMALIFSGMKERQDAFLTALEGVNCDTDALRPINDTWYQQYQALAQIAITQGDGEATAKAEKNFEKLRYFVDYFMRELVGRMYDLRCVNAAHYNQGILHFVCFVFCLSLSRSYFSCFSCLYFLFVCLSFASCLLSIVFHLFSVCLVFLLIFCFFLFVFRVCLLSVVYYSLIYCFVFRIFAFSFAFSCFFVFVSCLCIVLYLFIVLLGLFL